MAGTTISNFTSFGISLTKASQNPVTITSTGTIHATGSSSSAIFGGVGIPWTIANDGVIVGGRDGVRLVSDGTVTNGGTASIKASISGSLFGVRFNIHGAGTLNNLGAILATSTVAGSGVGVAAFGNANIVNGSTANASAAITGYALGVRIGGPSATVTNHGTIKASSTSTTVGSASIGVYLQTGGSVFNGSSKNVAALIEGKTWGINIQHAPGSVVNFGTIKGTGSLGRGIVLGAGGSVVNGSSTNSAAYIGAASRNGVYIGGTASSKVTNFGTIRSAGTNSSGVAIRSGGTVTNGSASNTQAVLSGGSHGVYIEGSLPSAVINSGTITSDVGSSISLYLGGNVINGSATNTKAFISSTDSTGIYLGGQGIVVNHGRVNAGASGVYLLMGGTIKNGSTNNKIASINSTGSRFGVYAKFGRGSVINYGTISAATGVGLLAGGSIMNGGTANSAALITGSMLAVSSNSSTTISNFGTIKGGANGINFGDIATADSTGKIINLGTILATGGAINVLGGGSVYNGSAFNTTAVIGATGHSIFIGSNGGAVTNYGTVNGSFSGIISGGKSVIKNYGKIISGNNGILFEDGNAVATGTVVNAGTISQGGGPAALGAAITFGSGNDRLVVVPGAVFVGKVIGGAGNNTLQLTKGGNGTISGIGSSFSSFATVSVDSGARWTLGGFNTTSRIINNGTLAVAAAGTLQLTAAVHPASSGIFQLNSTSILEVFADTGSSSKIQFLGAGKLIVDKASAFGSNVGKTTYTGPLIEDFGVDDTILFKDLAFSGTVLNYSTTSGLLQIASATTGMATLAFQNSSLGTGAFHSSQDELGHLMITRS